MVEVVHVAGRGLGRTRRGETLESAKRRSASAAITAQGVEGVLDELISSSVTLVPGADCAKVSTIEDGRLRTIIASSRMTAALDNAQQVARQGPCLEAVDSGTAVRCDDLGTDARWPRLAPHAATARVRSVLSCPIDVAGVTCATLTLFGSRVGAFGEHSEAIGAVLADHAALALLFERRTRQFEDALASRDLIGQAKGMIMERFAVDAAQAFILLRKLSQESNTPVRDLAARLAGSPHG